LPGQRLAVEVVYFRGKLGQTRFEWPQCSKLHTLWKRNMCVKVSDTVLPPITGLRITFITYTKALGTMGREFNAPFPPILSRHPPNWLSGPVFETSHTSEEKHVRESLRHGVTTHNWLEHYLWDIYGGFGHNGKIIQCTLPSHTQPSRSKLTVWASFRNFTHLGRETCT
jgi:hypothetical protein